MGSLNSIKLRNALKSGMTEVHVADTPVAIRMKYIGKGSVTGAQIAVDTDQDITLITSDGGTEEFLFADFLTMGALAEAINNSMYWNAELVDALRSDLTATSPFVDDLTTDPTGAGYYEAYIDTDISKRLTYRCAYNRNPNGENGVDSSRAKGAHRVSLIGFTYYCNNGGDEINGVQVWEYNPVLQTETQVYQAIGIDSVSTTVNFAGGEGVITSDWGNDLIVRIQDTAGTLADAGLILEVSYERE